MGETKHNPKQGLRISWNIWRSKAPAHAALNIAEAIEDVGGYINAYTSREATAYYLRLLRQDVRLGVDILLIFYATLPMIRVRSRLSAA